MRCPACDSAEILSPVAIPDFEYRVNFLASYANCKTCLSLFQVPMPNEEQLSSFYPAGYHSFATDSFLFRIKHALRARGFKMQLRPGAQVLDYGSGSGAFISWCGERYPDCRFIGYELSNENKIRTEKNCQFISGHFDFLLQQIKDLDVITMNHVIEHLPSPKLSLQKLMEKLRPKGIFIGQTPCTLSLEQSFFGIYWSGFHAPRHTVIFSRKGLGQLLSDLNFSPVHLQGGFNPAGVAISLLSFFNRQSPKPLHRSGPRWILSLFFATLWTPLDFLSGRPSMMNFYASKEPVSKI